MFRESSAMRFGSVLPKTASVLLRKKNGDKDNSEPGWCDYAAV